jgi:WhiB family transcriptional regulator, redox-sensing transcriptional regulator
MLQNWREVAACRDAVTANYDPFFDETETSERTAIAICQSCPVQGECLAYAIHTAQPYGVWGGKPQRELRRLIALDRLGQPHGRRASARRPPHAGRRRWASKVRHEHQGGGARG